MPTLALLAIQHIFLMSSTLVLPIVLVNEIGGDFRKFGGGRADHDLVSEGVSCTDAVNCTAVGFGSSPPQVSPITGPVRRPRWCCARSTARPGTGSTRAIVRGSESPLRGQLPRAVQLHRGGPGGEQDADPPAQSTARSWVRRRSPNPGAGDQPPRRRELRERRRAAPRSGTSPRVTRWHRAARWCFARPTA